METDVGVRVMWAVADCQTRSFVPIRQNFSLKVEAVVLKWVIMKVGKSEQRGTLNIVNIMYSFVT